MRRTLHTAGWVRYTNNLGMHACDGPGRPALFTYVRCACSGTLGFLELLLPFELLQPFRLRPSKWHGPRFRARALLSSFFVSLSIRDVQRRVFLLYSHSSLPLEVSCAVSVSSHGGLRASPLLPVVPRASHRHLIQLFAIHPSLLVAFNCDSASFVLFTLELSFRLQFQPRDTCGGRGQATTSSTCRPSQVQPSARVPRGRSRCVESHVLRTQSRDVSRCLGAEPRCRCASLQGRRSTNRTLVPTRRMFVLETKWTHPRRARGVFMSSLDL